MSDGPNPIESDTTMRECRFEFTIKAKITAIGSRAGADVQAEAFRASILDALECLGYVVDIPEDHVTFD